MEILHTIVTVLQVISAVAVIILVLLQHGKGADMGAAFGSGSSGSLFGATGSANFLSRATAFCATIFFLCTLGLSFYSKAPVAKEKGLMESMKVEVSPSEGAEKSVPDTPVKDIPK